MQNKAVKLSLLATALFMLAAAVLIILAPRLIRWYANYRQIPKAGRIAITAAFYGSVVPAIAALCCLWRLLGNIRRERPFLQENSRLMAVISWCCVLVALATGIAARWYLPLLFVTVSMAFIFLIVRVVRNCFIAAIAIKDENSLTI